MKIAFIATRLFPGGFTTSMLEMLDYLKEHGHECEVYFLESDRHELPLDLLKDTKYDSVERIHHSSGDILLKMRLKKQKKQYAEMQQRIDTASEESKPRLENALMQKMLADDIVNNYPKMDMTYYDCVISWEELRPNDFLALNVKAKKKIGYIHPDYEQAAFDPVEDTPILEKLDAVISVSKANQKKLQIIFPALSSKIHCVYNPLNAEKIETRKNEYMVPHERFTIVTVARIENKSKAIDRLVRIASRLEQDGFAFDWNVVGGGKDYDAVMQEIHTLHVHSVHMEGQKENPYPYINSADLFVLQSNYEGRSVTVEEAKALGIPVVITNYASAGEQITDGRNGFITENNEDAVYLKLKEILSHPEQLSLMRKELPLPEEDGTARLLKLMQE